MAIELEEWWVTRFGDLLMWSRFRLLSDGNVEVFESDGRTLRYPDEDSARAALLYGEFRAFDGLDEEDANEMGFSLDNIFPPEAEDEDSLIPLMTQRLSPKN